jgi:hypothetical protein
MHSLNYQEVMTLSAEDNVDAEGNVVNEQKQLIRTVGIAFGMDAEA